MAATTLKEAVIQALNKAANAFYSPQTLTPEQQEQARTNIGAMSAATSPSVPAGTILPFAGTAVPDGYLLCNGAEVSRTDYANLFAAIGTKYGAGDGSTTFAVPNLDGRVLQGTTNTGNVGNYLEAQLPNISGHLIDNFAGSYGINSDGAFSVRTNGLQNVGSVDIGSSGYFEFTFDASKSSSAYNGNKLQPSALQVLPCIKF